MSVDKGLNIILKELHWCCIVKEKFKYKIKQHERNIMTSDRSLFLIILFDKYMNDC